MARLSTNRLFSTVHDTPMLLSAAPLLQTLSVNRLPTTSTGSPGGGSGGAIYNDGDRMTLTISGSTFTDNHANEGGGAIFFVSNDRTGTMSIRGSTLTNNPNDGFHTAGLPGIFFLGARFPTITGSVLR